MISQPSATKLEVARAVEDRLVKARAVTMADVEELMGRELHLNVPESKGEAYEDRKRGFEPDEVICGAPASAKAPAAHLGNKIKGLLLAGS